jgi:hypothetical protein
MNITRDLPPPRSMPTGHDLRLRQTIVGVVAASSPVSTPVRRPRRRLVPPVAAAGLAGVAAVVAVNLLGASSAYASWTAVPDQLDATALATAGNACEQQLNAHFPGQATGLRPTVGETRGKFTAILLAAGQRVGICIAGIPHGSLGGILDLSPASSTTGLTLDAEPGLLAGPGAAREAFGRVIDPAVTKVVVNTTDHRSVTASVAGGFFLAWWPSGADPTDVTGYNAQGDVLSTVVASLTTTTPTQR